MDHIGIILAAKTVEGTRLHFSGDFTWWMAAILAGVAALAASWIYRGAIKGRVAPGLWMLPLLRVGAIVLVVMMLNFRGNSICSSVAFMLAEAST